MNFNCACRGICCVLIFVFLATQTKSQSIKELNLLIQQSEDYREKNSDSVFHFGQQALELSRSLHHTDAEIKARINICFACYRKGQYDLAIEHCTSAIDKYANSSKKIEIGDAYLFLGLTKINLGLYEDAIHQFLPLIDIAITQNNNYLLADACSNLGLAYVSNGNYVKAKKYYNTAIRIHQGIDHPHGKVYVYQNIGRIFFDQTEYDSAIYYLEQAWQLASSIENDHALFYASSLLGQIPDLDPSKTELYLTRAETIAETNGMQGELLNTKVFLADFYFDQQKYELSAEHAQGVVSMAKSTGDYSSLQHAYNLLVRIYTITQNVEKANSYLAMYKDVNDSLTNQDAEDVSAIIDANQMLDEERNYEVARHELNIAQADIFRKNLVIGFSIIIILLITVILFNMARNNRQKTKSNSKLALLNDKLDAALKEKDLLMGMTVHDLRSPLGNIQGLTEILKMNTNNSNEHNEIIDQIQKIVLSTNSLMEELLEISRIDSGDVKINEDEIEIEPFIGQVVEPYVRMAEKKGISVHTSFDLQNVAFMSDRFILHRVIENLISNAIKFTKSGGDVKIKTTLDGNLFTCSIKDNGLGIPKNEQEVLFKKFGKTSTQPTADEASAGLGLYIVDRLIESLRGSVRLESEAGRGSEFSIALPIS